MKEAVERWIAWHLPKRVVCWCVIRAYAKGFSVWPTTTGAEVP
jgi:hypothetical protein